MQNNLSTIDRKATALLESLRIKGEHIDVCMTYCPQLGQEIIPENFIEHFRKSALQRLIQLGKVKGELITINGVRFERFRAVPLMTSSPMGGA